MVRWAGARGGRWVACKAWWVVGGEMAGWFLSSCDFLIFWVCWARVLLAGRPDLRENDRGEASYVLPRAPFRKITRRTRPRKVVGTIPGIDRPERRRERLPWCPIGQQVLKRRLPSTFSCRRSISAVRKVSVACGENSKVGYLWFTFLHFSNLAVELP